MKRILYLLIITVVYLAFACGGKKEPEAPPPAKEDISDKIVLHINGSQFSNEDFKQFLKAQYPDMAENQNSDAFLSRVFDLFIEHQLVLHKANADQVTIEDTERDEYLQKLKMAKGSLNEKFLNDTIKVQKFLYFTAFNNITVTDKETQDYYKNNLDEFRRAEGVELYQILVKDKEKAIAIRGELIKAPGRFEQKAQEESMAPDVQKKGYMGFFERGMLPQEMEDVVFSLKINEISPIVQSPYGYHIFKVKRKKRKRLLYYEDIKEEIREKLLSEKLRQSQQNLLQDLKNELKVTIIKKHLYFTYSEKKGEQNNESTNKQNIGFNHLLGRSFRFG